MLFVSSNHVFWTGPPPSETRLEATTTGGRARTRGEPAIGREPSQLLLPCTSACARPVPLYWYTHFPFGPGQRVSIRGRERCRSYASETAPGSLPAVAASVRLSQSVSDSQTVSVTQTDTPRFHLESQSWVPVPRPGGWAVQQCHWATMNPSQFRSVSGPDQVSLNKARPQIMIRWATLAKPEC